MALQRDNDLKNAERLLRQGRVQAALDELQRTAAGSPRDLVLLNRIGDLLVRLGQGHEAVGYYSKLADQFVQGGFFPKAIAIYKKILRIEAGNAGALHQLGELYLNQQLPGEARAHLNGAAKAYLAASDFGRARKVYEALVAAEPGDPRHRVALAETRAAAGEAEPAGQELLAVAVALLREDRAADAERAYNRAAELLEDPVEARCGTALCLAVQGRHDEAVAAIDKLLREKPKQPVASATLAVVHEMADGSEEAAGALREGSAETFIAYVRTMALHPAAGGRAEAAWERLDPILERWGVSDPTIALLERLAEIEENGHLPALDRLYRTRKQQGDREAAKQALARLIEGYQTRSMHGEAARLAQELRDLSPAQPAAPKEEEVEVEETGEASRAKPEAETPEPPAAPVPSEDRPSATPEARMRSAEAPAVPLNPADEEFVSGHLTEAEVLQKYGLLDEALQRLRSVTSRFPGHVDALTRLATLVRSHGDAAAHSEVLAQLAVARRAAGETEEAREAAREAAERSTLPEQTRTLLEGLGLIEPVKAPPPAEPAPEVAAGAPASIETEESESDEVEVLFDDEAPAPEATPDTGERLPPAEVLEEIAFFREQGMLEEARQKLAALRTLGYSPGRLDELEADLARAASAPEEAGVEGSSAAADLRLDDEELGEIAAALEAELSGVSDDDAAPTAPEGEESLEDVFAEFKRQVESEVGSEDYQTHYDLGIAYKEMGLMDDALKEFELATRSPEIHREACSMLAVCQRQRGEMAEAARWYQTAIDAPGGTEEERQGLRYDLAEVLLQQGEDRAALDLFRHILEEDAGYRDVQTRVTELQSRLGS